MHINSCFLTVFRQFLSEFSDYYALLCPVLKVKAPDIFGKLGQHGEGQNAQLF